MAEGDRKWSTAPSLIVAISAVGWAVLKTLHGKEEAFRLPSKRSTGSRSIRIDRKDNSCCSWRRDSNFRSCKKSSWDSRIGNCCIHHILIRIRIPIRSLRSLSTLLITYLKQPTLTLFTRSDFLRFYNRLLFWGFSIGSKLLHKSFLFRSEEANGREEENAEDCTHHVLVAEANDWLGELASFYILFPTPHSSAIVR